jgi:hypothetical protein
VFSLSFTELANNEMLIIACATFEAKLSGSLSQALSHEVFNKEAK